MERAVGLVLGLPWPTLAAHAIWLLLTGYGLWHSGRSRRSRPDHPGRPDPPSRSGGPGWWIAFGAILALALALRLYELGQRSLWLDEAISLWLARLPFGDLLPTLATHDESPPLYFALLHLWRRFGENEAALRLISVLASVVAVALAGALGRLLGGRGAGLLAALCLALSSVQLSHGQETRMYSLVTALTLVTTYGALRLQRRVIRGPAVTADEPADEPKSATSSTPTTSASAGASAGLLPALIWGATLASLAALHHTAALAGAGAALGGLLAALLGRQPFRPALRPLAIGALTGAVLWAPVAPVFVAQSRLVAEHYWIPRPTPAYVLGVLLDASLGSLPLPRHVQISDPLTLRRPADVVSALLALPRLEPWRQLSLVVAGASPAALLLDVGAMLYIGLAAAGRRRGPAGSLIPLGVVAFPVVALLLVSQVRPLLLARTLVGSGAVALVVVAVATVALPRLARIPAVLALLTVLLLGLGQYWWYPGLEEWRPAAGHLAAEALPGDLVLIDGRWTQLPLDYYLARAGAPPLEEHGVPIDFGAAGKPEPVTSEDDLPRLRRLTAGRERVWLVLSHSFDTDPQGLTRKALEAEFPCFEVWPYQGVALHLFRRCAAASP